MFEYNIVVRVSVGIDGKYKLVWGTTQELEKIGLSKAALSALVADRFSTWIG